MGQRLAQDRGDTRGGSSSRTRYLNVAFVAMPALALLLVTLAARIPAAAITAVVTVDVTETVAVADTITLPARVTVIEAISVTDSPAAVPIGVPTTTTVAASPAAAVFGQSVTFTATVAPVMTGAGTPTGTITFKDGAATLGTGSLSGGAATFSTSTLAVGTHAISAAYGGDGNNLLASTSSQLSEIVSRADSGTTVTSSVNPSVFGQSVTFNATVAAVAPGAGTPGGMVTFMDGAATLGTGTLSGGVTSFSSPSLGIGSHAVAAVYEGDGDFNGSTSGPLSEIVNKADSGTAVTSSLNPSVFGQSVTFTASVTSVAPGAGTPGGTVTFKDGGATLGTGALSGGVATFSSSTLGVGTHAITAVYAGNTRFNSSSSPALTQAVSCPATLSIPLAIVDENGRIVAVGTIQGTEQTTGSLCSVVYRLFVRGVVVGTGTFVADHQSTSTIVISQGTFAVFGRPLPLTFGGTIETTAGTATLTFTFTSGKPSRTTTIHFVRLSTGDFVITSVAVSHP